MLAAAAAAAAAAASSTKYEHALLADTIPTTSHDVIICIESVCRVVYNAGSGSSGNLAIRSIPVGWS